MASPEGGRLGQPGGPPNFENIVAGLTFDTVQDERQLRPWEGMNRFGSEFAERVEKWQLDGVVRMGGIRLPSTTPRAAWDVRGVMGMYVSIPYPPNPDRPGPRFAIMLPDVSGMQVVVIKQKLSKATDDEIAALENDDHETRFLSAFRPGQTPAIHPTWQPEQGISTKHAFLHVRSSMGADIDDVIQGRDPQEVVDEAIAYAYAVHSRKPTILEDPQTPPTGVESWRRRPSRRERDPIADQLVVFEAMLNAMPDEPDP